MDPTVVGRCESLLSGVGLEGACWECFVCLFHPFWVENFLNRLVCGWSFHSANWSLVSYFRPDRFLVFGRITSLRSYP